MEETTEQHSQQKDLLKEPKKKATSKAAAPICQYGDNCGSVAIYCEAERSKKPKYCEAHKMKNTLIWADLKKNRKRRDVEIAVQKKEDEETQSDNDSENKEEEDAGINSSDLW